MSQVTETMSKWAVVTTNECIFSFFFRHSGIRPTIKAHYYMLPGYLGDTRNAHSPPCSVPLNKVPEPIALRGHRTRCCSYSSPSIGFSSLPALQLFREASHIFPRDSRAPHPLDTTQPASHTLACSLCSPCGPAGCVVSSLPSCDYM